MDHLPLVKVSELQKRTKQVMEAVKEDGYRFVVNRGNPEVVIVSMAFFQNTFGVKSTDKKRKDAKDAIDAAFGIWKNDKGSWREILKELREEDNKKPFDVYLKKLLKWQKREFS